MSLFFASFINFVQNIINCEFWVFLIMSFVFCGLIACVRKLAY